MLALLIPIEREGFGFHYVKAIYCEDTENNRKVLTDKAKEIKGSLIYATVNYCTVKIIYGGKR